MSLNPFKKKIPKSEAEQIEDAMIFKYNLTKDLEVPNRFWLNNEKFIDFIPGDKDSREAAEKAIQTYYRTPQLMDATVDQRKTKPMANKKKKSGMGDFLENAGKGAEKVFGPVGDSFIKNAPNVTNELSNVGMGTMRDGVKNAQQLGAGDITQAGLGGFNPKIDMGAILGQVKKTTVKKSVPKGRPPRKTTK